MPATDRDAQTLRPIGRIAAMCGVLGDQRRHRVGVRNEAVADQPRAGMQGYSHATTRPARTRPSCQRLRFGRSEEHTSELQSHLNLVCRLLLEKKKNKNMNIERINAKITTAH